MPEAPSHPASGTATLELRERGAPHDGVPQFLDRRLYFQLIALEVTAPVRPDSVASQLRNALQRHGLSAVIYADVHHPYGLGVVACSEEFQGLTARLRSTLLDHRESAGIRIRSEYSMLGRTYSTGFEQDLTYWLLERPRRTLIDPANRFAIWYPLRRKGPFERLEPRQKGAIMQEHGGVGRAYGDLDLAHDIRLACHGLDVNDNDFVVGLLGKDVYPLSHVVQAMRKTAQTAEHMEKMGPFFVGEVVERTND